MSSSWKGKTRGGVSGYKIFVFLIESFGVKAAYFLLYFVSFYFVFASPKSTRYIFRYFRSIHHYNVVKSGISLYRSYFVFGQSIIDKVAIGAGKRKQYKYTFDGRPNLRKLVGSGGMIFSAHLGNWDVAGFLLDEMNMKNHILMFQEEHKNIKEYLGTVMKNIQMNIIPITDDMSHIFTIHSVLENKEVICAHGDRFVEGSRVVKRKLMGKDAWFPLGVFAIAAKKKVPYTFAYAFREKSMTYALSATTVRVSESPEAILDDYIEVLEEKMRKYPLQWFNFYDFWSEVPMGASTN